LTASSLPSPASFSPECSPKSGSELNAHRKRGTSGERSADSETGPEIEDSSAMCSCGIPVLLRFPRGCDGEPGRRPGIGGSSRVHGHDVCPPGRADARWGSSPNDRACSDRVGVKACGGLGPLSPFVNGRVGLEQDLLDPTRLCRYRGMEVSAWRGESLE